MTQAEHITIVRADWPLWRRLVTGLAMLGAQLFLIGVGVVVGSAAMQWAGFVTLGLILIAWVAATAALRMTPQQAADHLHKQYGVTAGGVRNA